MSDIKHLLYKSNEQSDTFRLTPDTLVMLDGNLIAWSPFTMVGMSFAVRTGQLPLPTYNGFATFLWDVDGRCMKGDGDNGWKGYRFLPGHCTIASDKQATVNTTSIVTWLNGYVLLRNGSPVFYNGDTGLYIWRQTASWVAALVLPDNDLPVKPDTTWFMKSSDSNTMPMSADTWTLYRPEDLPKTSVSPLPTHFQFYFTHDDTGITPTTPKTRAALNITLSFASVTARHTVHTNAGNKAIGNGVRIK